MRISDWSSDVCSADLGPTDNDLTKQHAGEPIGERMILSGRVLDENGRPVPRTLIELWQANSTGRYRHAIDQHDAPLDPNFTGYGRTVTDDEGRYRFVTRSEEHTSELPSLMSHS